MDLRRPHKKPLRGLFRVESLEGRQMLSGTVHELPLPSPTAMVGSGAVGAGGSLWLTENTQANGAAVAPTPTTTAAATAARTPSVGPQPPSTLWTTWAIR